MPGRDPTHWLHRLDAEEWLAAAITELRHTAETLQRRAYRPGVTHARRAAGMALNAILITHPNDAWGRSYMEHVSAVAKDAAVPAAVRDAARLLTETRPVPPDLVQIGKPDLSALEAAQVIIDHARAVVPAAASSTNTDT